MVVPAERFAEFLRGHPRAAEVLERQVTERREEDRARLFSAEDAGAERAAAERRLAWLLPDLAQRRGGHQHAVFTLPMSQQELADWAGTSADAVGRFLRSWRDRGIVARGERSRRLTVIDLDGLAALSDTAPTDSPPPPGRRTAPAMSRPRRPRSHPPSTHPQPAPDASARGSELARAAELRDRVHRRGRVLRSAAQRQRPRRGAHGDVRDPAGRFRRLGSAVGGLLPRGPRRRRRHRGAADDLHPAPGRPAGRRTGRPAAPVQPPGQRGGADPAAGRAACRAGRAGPRGAHRAGRDHHRAHRRRPGDQGQAGRRAGRPDLRGVGLRLRAGGAELRRAGGPGRLRAHGMPGQGDARVGLGVSGRARGPAGAGLGRQCLARAGRRPGPAAGGAAAGQAAARGTRARGADRRAAPGAAPLPAAGQPRVRDRGHGRPGQVHRRANRGPDGQGARLPGLVGPGRRLGPADQRDARGAARARRAGIGDRAGAGGRADRAGTGVGVPEPRPRRGPPVAAGVRRRGQPRGAGGRRRGHPGRRHRLAAGRPGRDRDRHHPDQGPAGLGYPGHAARAQAAGRRGRRRGAAGPGPRGGRSRRPRGARAVPPPGRAAAGTAPGWRLPGLAVRPLVHLRRLPAGAGRRRAARGADGYRGAGRRHPLHSAAHLGPVPGRARGRGPPAGPPAAACAVLLRAGHPHPVLAAAAAAARRAARRSRPCRSGQWRPNGAGSAPACRACRAPG